MSYFRAVEQANAIRDALQEVVAALEDGESPEEALRQASEETGLNPKLIERKFMEQHKVPPKDYLNLQNNRLNSQAAHAEAKVKEAVAEAHEWSKSFTYSVSTRSRIGRLFKIDGEQYALVAITQEAYPINAVQVKNKRRLKLRGSDTMKAVTTMLRGA